MNCISSVDPNILLELSELLHFSFCKKVLALLYVFVERSQALFEVFLFLPANFIFGVLKFLFVCAGCASLCPFALSALLLVSYFSATKTFPSLTSSYNFSPSPADLWGSYSIFTVQYLFPIFALTLHWDRLNLCIASQFISFVPRFPFWDRWLYCR